MKSVAEQPSYPNHPQAFAMNLDTDVHLVASIRFTMADAEHEAFLSLTDANGFTVVAPLSEEELVRLGIGINKLLEGHI